MTIKWFLVPGFIGIVFLIAVFLIQDCLLFLFKWNLITRYPVIFNFRVGTGRVLEKKFGTGRVPGSRQGLLTVGPDWQFRCLRLGDHFLYWKHLEVLIKHVINEGEVHLTISWCFDSKNMAKSPLVLSFELVSLHARVTSIKFTTFVTNSLTDWLSFPKLE